MKNNMINFEDLEKKEIKALIYTDNEDNVITVYDKSKIKNLLETVENPIIIKNPDGAAQKEIATMLIPNNSQKNENSVTLGISGISVMTKLIPLLTNIYLNLNPQNEDDLKRINEILSNPSDVLKATIRVLTNIVKNVSDTLLHNIDEIQALPENQKQVVFDKLAKESVEKDEKKKKLQDLKEEVKKLENEVGA